MNKWIAEFELEDGDKMPEHMDLTYKGIKLDFHCRPITECEDAISRQEVIETIKELNWRYNGHPGREVYGAIIELPSVRPKVGHWMWNCSTIPSTPVSPEEIDYCGWVCSECKQFPDDNDWDDPDEPPHYRYCPNCGCPMESE